MIEQIRNIIFSSNFIQVLGPAIGIIVTALLGICTWRMQRNSEFAETLIGTIQESIRVIKLARFSPNMQLDGKILSEYREKINKENSAKSTIMILDKNNEVFENLRKFTYRANVLFGENTNSSINIILDTRKKIVESAILLTRGGADEDVLSAAKYVWEGFDENNDINNKLDKSLSDAETILRNYILINYINITIYILKGFFNKLLKKSI